MERGHCDGPTVESLLAGRRVQINKIQVVETHTLCRIDRRDKPHVINDIILLTLLTHIEIPNIDNNMELMN